MSIKEYLQENIENIKKMYYNDFITVEEISRKYNCNRRNINRLFKENNLPFRLYGKNLLGKIFGKLTVIKWLESRNGNEYWLCQCECGNTKEIPTKRLNYGRVQSCGCLRSENGKKQIKKIIQPISEESLVKHLFIGYLARAKNKKFEFSIDMEYFSEIIFKNCYYCGCEPNNLKRNRSKNNIVEILYNGIDRIKNDKGYILGNCVPCCKNCNVAKMSMSEKEFLEWIRRVYEHKNLSGWGVS